MSSRFDIALGKKPPEPEKFDIDPLVKYHANKNIQVLALTYNIDAGEIGKYANYLGRTLDKKQVANLFADSRRLTVSYRNYFKNVVAKDNHIPYEDADNALTQRELTRTSTMYGVLRSL